MQSTRYPLTRLALYLWAGFILLNVPNITDAVQQTWWTYRDHAPMESVIATFEYHLSHYWENN